MDRPLTIALANSGRKWIGEIAHVAMLYEQLEALGHRPWIVCRQGYALHERCAATGWRHLDLAFNSRFSPFGDGRDLARWIGWARRERPDVLHCHRGKDHWMGLGVALAMGRPLVRTRHVVMPVARHLANRWLYLRATGAVLCVSKAARAGFGPWADRLPKGQVILSAVDTEKFSPQRRSEAWRRGQGGENALWFGLVGRFQSIKGQHVFLEAAGRVAAERPEARFMLAGAGSADQARKYREHAAKLGFEDRLTVLGYLENLPEVLASLDVGVIASLGSEGSSRIALEMMASGLPIVATRVGGIPDLCEAGGTARLVPPGDPAALAEAMAAWAADPAARAEAGRQARERILANHQPRQWAERIVSVYRELIRQ